MNDSQYQIFPTMKCSLSCQHCFIDKELIKSDQSMSIEQFKIVSEKIALHFKQSNSQYSVITIIGGEPTLLSTDYYLTAIPYLRNCFNKTNKKYFIQLVTNLLHYNKYDRIRHLFDCVATSYEPSRFSSLNASTNIKQKGITWRKNLDKCLSENHDLSIGITMTQDVIEQGTKLLDYFTQKGVKALELCLMIPSGKVVENEFGSDFYKNQNYHYKEELLIPVRSRDKIISDKLSIIPDFNAETNYLINVTEWFYKQYVNGNTELEIFPIKDKIRAIRDMESGPVSFSDCLIKTSLHVRPDGKVSSCESNMGKCNMLSYGNMYTDSIDSIMNSEIRQKHIAMKFRLERECMSCEFLSGCHGDCMIRSKFKKNDSNNCQGLKPYLLYLRKNIDRLSQIL